MDFWSRDTPHTHHSSVGGAKEISHPPQFTLFPPCTHSRTHFSSFFLFTIKITPISATAAFATVATTPDITLYAHGDCVALPLTHAGPCELLHLIDPLTPLNCTDFGPYTSPFRPFRSIRGSRVRPLPITSWRISASHTRVCHLLILILSIDVMMEVHALVIIIKAFSFLLRSMSTHIVMQLRPRLRGLLNLSIYFLFLLKWK